MFQVQALLYCVYYCIVFSLYIIKVLVCLYPPQVGDGTTSVVLLAGEFLKECKSFIDEGVHPQVIVRAYRKATNLVRLHTQHSDFALHTQLCIFSVLMLIFGCHLLVFIHTHLSCFQRGQFQCWREKLCPFKWLHWIGFSSDDQDVNKVHCTTPELCRRYL